MDWDGERSNIMIAMDEYERHLAQSIHSLSSEPCNHDVTSQWIGSLESPYALHPENRGNAEANALQLIRHKCWLKVGIS
jgi:hypothetical protein